MDVIFENHSGKAFCIEVGFFDTVLEIKQKVQKYQGIPVTSQTLVINAKVLEDERDVEYYEILHNSHILLIVASDSDDGNYKQQPRVDEQQKKQTSSSSKETQLKVNDNAPSSEALVLLEMDVNDTFFPLKEMVQDQIEVEPVPVNRLVVQSDRGQRTENNIVDANLMPPPPTSYGKREEGISTDSEKLKLTKNKNADVNLMPPPKSSGKRAQGDTSSGKGAAGATSTTGLNMLKPTWKDVNTMPPPTSSGKGAAEGTKLKWKDTCNVDIMPLPTSSGKGAAKDKAITSTGKLKLLVLPWHGTKKVAVEVNATDNVEDLRKELQKLQKEVLFPLPEGGYFFIHKQRVMDEDRSFKWNHVAQGDTIEIFSGYVTRE